MKCSHVSFNVISAGESFMANFTEMLFRHVDCVRCSAKMKTLSCVVEFTAHSAYYPNVPEE